MKFWGLDPPVTVAEGKITPYKSLEIPVRNQKSRGVNQLLEIFGITIRNEKSRTPKPKIPLKNKKSRTLNVEVTYPSTKTTMK